MKQSTRRRWVALVVVATSIGCTMKTQDAPPLAGPSEFGTSLAIAIAPEVLQQDGVSQSTITVTARGPNGAAISSLPLRAEIRVDGVTTNFGTLSARNLMTASDGRAVLTYTAPPPPPIPVPATTVDIAVTPAGTDFNNAAVRFASVKVVPHGALPPSDTLKAQFVHGPDEPKVNETVLFDGSDSTASPNSPIVSYHWDYGDGYTGSGRTSVHHFREVGAYAVRLTVTDTLGRTAQRAKTITVKPEAAPSAVFTYSPTPVRVNREVFFNASQSTAEPGRRITQYAWDFGDGTPGATGVQVSKIFPAAGTYKVTLTVTDDANRSKSVAQDVTVAP